MASVTKKYVGLWIGKMRRPGAPKREACADPWRRWPEDYYADYYYRIKRVGVPTQQGSTRTQNLKEATEFAQALYVEAMRAWRNPVLQAVSGIGKRGRVATMQELFDGYLRPKAADGKPVEHWRKDARRVVTSNVLWIARAKGWRAEWGRVDMGDDLAVRVGRLPSDEVFTRAMRQAYYRWAQGGTFDPSKRSRDHITVNQTLNFAEGLWAPRALAYCYEGLTLPDYKGWMEEPALLVSRIDIEEEAIPKRAYTAMLDAVEGLERGTEEERELALVNRMLSMLGLRSGELVAARREWLVLDEAGRVYLWVKNRPEEGFEVKGGVSEGKIPLERGLADRLLAREGFLILPGGSDRERERLIRVRHNRWLKGIIGESRNRQGNHRLRKYVATVLLQQCGIGVASKYLRHSGEAVTLQSYAARLKESLPEVSVPQLAAWSAVAE